jgi:transcriptional repressor NrdR
MRCPNCGHSNSKVTDSREVESGIRRRRECRACKVRFTTYERLQSTAMMVSKRDSRREEFNREKLVSGIRKACAKRPITSRTIEKMVEDIEAELQHLGHGEVPSSAIGEMVMERLSDLDRVAYIRFASVYRDFQDIESFEQAVSDLREGNSQPTRPEIQAGRSRRTRRRSSSKPPLQRLPRVNGSDSYKV